MNNIIIQLLGTAALCASLVSCSELRSPHYVGTIVDIPAEDLGNESVWVVDEDMYTIRRTGSNSFVAATMEWIDKTESYQAITTPIVLSELNEQLYLQLKDGEEYIILRAVCSLDESFVLFTINKDVIEQDIADGKISARKSGDKIILQCSKAEQDEYIANNGGRIFSYDCARVARNIYEGEKPDKK